MSTDIIASPARPPDTLPTFRPISGSRSPNGRPSSYASDDSSRHRQRKANGDRPDSPGRLQTILKRGRSKDIVSKGDQQVRNQKVPLEKKQRRSSNFLLHPFNNVSKKRQNHGSPSNTPTKSKSGQEDYAGIHEPTSTLLPDGPAAQIRASAEQGNGHADVPDDASTYGSSRSGISSNRKGKERLMSLETDDHSTSGAGSSKASHQRNGQNNAEPTTQQARSMRHTSADVDPGQIVRMALTLNESRRLGLAPGQLPLGGSLNGRRAASAGLYSASPGIDRRTPRHVSSTLPVPEDRRQARSPTSSIPTADGAGSREASGSPAAPRFSSLLTPLFYESALGYDMSPATLLRAEKARAYFELCHEYRRLLDVLPPLRPRSDQGPPESLGRAYNPLQYIRNRRSRARERQSLDGAKAGFDQVERVDKWVSLVEMDAKEKAFYDGDIACLPRFESEQGVFSPDTVATTSDNLGKRERREWKSDPADLLADAYWLEQEKHKTLIEDRHGEKIFASFSKPTASPLTRIFNRRGRATTDASRVSDGVPLGRNTSPTNEQSDDSDIDEGLEMRTAKRGHKPRKSKRNLFGRRKTVSDDELLSSDSDGKSITDGAKHVRSGFIDGTNTGPLEKHMRMIMQKEARRKTSVDSEASLQPTATENSNSRGQRRRGGVSEEYNDILTQSASRRRSSLVDTPHSPRSSLSVSTPGTPRISIDDYDRDESGMNGHALSPTTSGVRKRKAFPLGFIRKREDSKRRNQIAESDFAIPSAVDPKPGAFDFRQSINHKRNSTVGSRADSYDSSMGKDDERRSSDTDLKSKGERAAARSATTRFFKGGRIGEIVKNEASPKSDVIWKAEPPRKLSTAPGVDGEARHTLGLFAPRDHLRSRSTNDLQATGKYHTADLPTFRSSTATQDESNHISRQQQELRLQKSSRKSRFNRLAPISTFETPEVSPNNSQVDLSRQQTFDSSHLDDPSVYNSSRASSPGLGEAGRRLGKVLAVSGVSAHGGLPPTGLSGLSAGKRSRSRNHREWNIAEEQDVGPTDIARLQDIPVTAKDIAYVRTLLLSSGIKATRIVRMANEFPAEISPFLMQAYKSANMQAVPASKREEHVIAARILSKQLSQTVSDFESVAETFRAETCTTLHARIDELREQVAEKLTPEVRSCTDDADALIAQLTTTHNLAVKQVNDNVELMMRNRWKRLRRLRRVGFTLLEWLFVAILWWIWLLVLVIRAVRAVVVTLVRGVRWLLWL